MSALNQWEPVFERALFDARNYRDFLSLFFLVRRAQADAQGKWSRPKRITFQSFADRAGFTSKSFMSEILSGRRRMTLRAFPKVVKGLKLSPGWAEYLRILVEVEEPEFQNTGDNAEKASLKLQKQQGKLVRLRETLTEAETSKLSRLTLEPSITDICVAIGDPRVGATIEKIQDVSHLPVTVLRDCLKRMVRIGLVRYDSETSRYHNVPQAMNALHGSKNSHYQRYFWSRLVRAHQSMLSKKSGVHMTQTFTVKRSSLDALIKEFEKKIIEIADEADEIDGDGIAEIVVSLTHNFED